MSVFVDTSALLAVVHAGDLRHEAATAVWTNLMQAPERPVTSNYVVLESVSLVHHRYGLPAARRFMTDILAAVDIVWVDDAIHNAALLIMCASPRIHRPSLVDCVSFEIIDRNNISAVFAYDRHFDERGLNMVGE